MAEFKEGYSPDIKQSEPLAQLAEEVAKRTREEGMGMLHGKFPPNIAQPGKVGVFTSVHGFIQGTENIQDIDEGSNFWRMLSARTGDKNLPYEVWYPYTQINRQVWTASEFHPPTIWEKKVTSGRFPFKRTEIRNERYDYKGKIGPIEGVQYDYFMPVGRIYDIGNRPGVFVNLTVVVPPEIASKIDAIDLQKHPEFPDLYMKSLYPGFIGSDTKTQIHREQAIELFVRDWRKNPDPKAGIVIPYPKPIPY